jgi:hypothetical protein
LEAQTPALRPIYARTSTTLAVQLSLMSKGSVAKILFQFVGKPEEFSGYFAVSNIDRHSAAFGSQVVQFYKGFKVLRHVRHLP